MSFDAAIKQGAFLGALTGGAFGAAMWATSPGSDWTLGLL